jgi:hypothetical protein
VVLDPKQRGPLDDNNFEASDPALAERWNKGAEKPMWENKACNRLRQSSRAASTHITIYLFGLILFTQDPPKLIYFLFCNRFVFPLTGCEVLLSLSKFHHRYQTYPFPRSLERGCICFSLAFWNVDRPARVAFCMKARRVVLCCMQLMQTLAFPPISAVAARVGTHPSPLSWRQF